MVGRLKIYEKNMDGWMDKKIYEKRWMVGWIKKNKKKWMVGWIKKYMKKIWMVGWIKKNKKIWMVGWIKKYMKKDGWLDV